MFLMGAFFLVFLLGYFVYRENLFPKKYIEAALLPAQQVLAVPHHLYPIVYDETGVKIGDAGKMQPGLTLISTYWSDFDWQAGIKLVDTDGRVMHQWSTNPASIWPESDNARRQADNYVHGTYLFDNGDVVFNIEYAGMVRMNSCGEILWKLDYSTHHSVFRDDDGNFWVSGNITRAVDPDGEEYIKDYPGLNLPVYEDVAIQVSPEGQILREIPLFKVIYDNGLQRYIAKHGAPRRGDILHLNDVEALGAADADKYPMFDAGDLLLSFRFIDLVVVMDPDTGRVKWFDSNSTIEQHDPDFMGDGRIGIYDNNVGYTPRGDMLGGSRIVAVRPDTGTIEQLLPRTDKQKYSSKTGGKWQQLANGNLLLVEARAGRAFEVTASGDVIWQWFTEHFDDSLVPEVLEATRYDLTADDIAAWQCSTPG